MEGSARDVERNAKTLRGMQGNANDLDPNAYYEAWIR